MDAGGRVDGTAGAVHRLDPGTSTEEIIGLGWGGEDIPAIGGIRSVM